MRSRHDAGVTALLGGLALVLAALAGACSKSDHAPPASTIVTGGDDTGAATTDTSVEPIGDSAPNDTSDAVEQPDFGPVPDVVVVDGPVIGPPPDNGPLTFCASDSVTLSGIHLVPSSAMPAAFTSAWNAVASTVNGGGGVLLLQLSALESNPQKVNLNLGSPDPAHPTAFPSGLIPTSAGLSVDATTRTFGAQAQSGVLMAFIDPSTNSGPSIFAGAFAIDGTLDATCQSATSVKLQLRVAVSEGTKTLNGTALKDLLGAPNTVVGPKDAWMVTLVGDLPKVGG